MPVEASQRPIDAMHGRRVFAAAGLASVGAIVAAAREDWPLLATLGAAAFALAVVAGVVIAPIVSARSAGDWTAEASFRRLRQSALLAALAYAWGALAMQGAYLTPLTGLRWQHGWQYALAMLLLAVGAIVLAGPPRTPTPGITDVRVRLAVPLAMAQMLVAAGGLAALAVSGKLWSNRADWAANRVFAGLAVAILAISAAYLVAGRRPVRS